MQSGASDLGGSAHCRKRKAACFSLQVITPSLDMLGICVLLKLSYYLVNGHHAMLADGHKECQNVRCVSFLSISVQKSMTLEMPVS